MPVQWAQLGAGKTLVASSRRAWLQRPQLGALNLRGEMPDVAPATSESTRQLLDGAIAAAERAAPDRAPPAMTPRRWAWQLVAQWYTAHHSVALLPDLIERFERADRPDLDTFARRKLDEETGHDEFAIDGLTAIGYDTAALVRAVEVSPDAGALVEYARACVRSDAPVEFLGYAYALERRVIRITPEMIAAIDALFDPGVDATSGLRAHAGVLDIEHVEEFVAFVAGLPGRDRARIALGCFRTTEIACAPLPGQHPAETELQRRLAPFLRNDVAALVAAQIDPQRGDDR